MRRVLAAAVVVVMAIPALSAPAGADLFVNWATLLPSVPNPNDPTNPDICANGASTCVNHTITKMERAAAPLISSCSDNAVFALAYLRTTQTYKWARNQPGFFQDTPWVNYEDAVFASMYFQAFNGWYGGGQGTVPPAWQIAFAAADRHQVTGSGNLLLGMNAHVNADLPFVLYEIGLVAPDGSSRKPDHEAVNVFLDDELNALLSELAARFDPSVNPPATPDGIGLAALFQLLESWRESAWNEAQQLADARDPATFATVAASIQAAAAAQARAIVATSGYTPSVSSPASRFAYCQANKYAPAPVAYPWGYPSSGH